MKTDPQIKALLVLIAIALFMNALGPWLRPAPAMAAQTPPADLPMMEVHLREMESYLEEIAPDIERIVELLIEQRDTQRLPQCDWTMIDDGGTPTIGRNGELDLSPEWERVSRSGWMLKAVHSDEFIFERCR